MASIPIDLPKSVRGETLEQACIKAARELGYRTQSIDEVHKRYSLGSIQEHRDYEQTNMKIGNLLPAFQVRGILKGKQQDRFYVYTGFPHGFASDKRVQEYLSRITKYLY